MLLFLLLACDQEPVAAGCESVPVPMADGRRLAADVCRPAGVEGPVPTVLVQTRYWRSFALRVPDTPGRAPLGPRDGVGDALLAAGYAFVVVDVRGTGASVGVWAAPFAPQEVADAAVLLD